MILDIPYYRIEWLKKWADQYNLYLFSNTNAIHYQKYNDDLMHNYGFSLDKLFKKTYYSHRIGLRKPNIKSYQFVISDSGINPHETLFIDDFEENITGAAKAGLNALLLKGDVVNCFKP